MRIKTQLDKCNKEVRLLEPYIGQTSNAVQIQLLCESQLPALPQDWRHLVAEQFFHRPKPFEYVNQGASEQASCFDYLKLIGHSSIHFPKTNHNI